MIGDRCYSCRKQFDADDKGFRFRLQSFGKNAHGAACSRDIKQAFCSAACIRDALVEIAEEFANWDKVLP